MRRFGILLELLEIGLVNDVPARVERSLKFCVWANTYSPRVFSRVQPDVLPERLRGAQPVGVEAHAGAGAPGRACGRSRDAASTAPSTCPGWMKTGACSERPS